MRRRKVLCRIEHEWHELDGYDREITLVECRRCLHEVEAYGHSEESEKYAFAQLRRECPRKENNFYEEDSH